VSKKILITGSSGFIGTSLKHTLVTEGYPVVDFNSSDGDIESAPLNFSGVDYVIHLAGKSFVPDSWKNPAEFMRVNVEGTRNVLEFCRKNNTPLMFMSSYVYGIPVRLPIDENHPVNPSNPYAQSKHEAEKVCMAYTEKYGVPVTILRPFNVFGKNQPGHFLVPKIIAQALDRSQKQVELFDLSPKRDYVYMDDLVRAMVLLLEKRKTGIFNIGSARSLSVKEIAEIILKAAGVKKEIVSSCEVRHHEIPDVVADISKIKSETGWTPETPFKEGIRKIIAAEKN
jgi:nucleoside-diphosphate-sugar epimerase